jgi:hypothetical protein
VSSERELLLHNSLPFPGITSSRLNSSSWRSTHGITKEPQSLKKAQKFGLQTSNTTKVTGGLFVEPRTQIGENLLLVLTSLSTIKLFSQPSRLPLTSTRMLTTRLGVSETLLSTLPNVPLTAINAQDQTELIARVFSSV